MSFVAAGDEYDDDLDLYDYGGSCDEPESKKETFPEPTLNSLVGMARSIPSLAFKMASAIHRWK